ncbi:DUF3368 domain-containing protein [cf. Phormidesmis sp. LEGE 11477]|uniref:DUF3368 domain-containing protein n=1 Tax=cf. Phormidesmis sp. LEGE 11477 TaxID=1828680 RepID=UPI00187F4D38|nr:DUF3368 domain-containing protein [cf. Phormidesmis sp. LEGE 11477]MBE9062533.1 DUF3368 domain-containing protein [cf. Phormidesmis sp. LEGE 11477]
MIVVSDTSPLLYLFLIDSTELLPQLYDQVIVPEAVKAEMVAPGAPTAFQTWAVKPPDWLLVESVNREISTELQNLHAGEQAAICLAKSLDADFLLIDERMGRQAATSKGLNVIGTLGILDEAAERNMVDIRLVVSRLRQTNFRISSKLIQMILNRHDLRL